jgi:aryl-alcohol dehydrogenase-like predicted oxidoreductase
MIPARRFGGTGLDVSALGMGCARLGAFWQRRSPTAGLRALREAADAGITFFDTADSYARGISERLVGRALAGRQVVVCTKVGYLKTPAAKAAARPHGGGTQCFAPEYVRLAAERSLRRLGTDTLDVLLLHSPPRAVIERAAFLDAAGRLREQGKVRAFGVSCDAPADALAALALPEVEVLEIAYNERVAVEAKPVLEDASRRGVAVIARSVFGDRTLLAGSSSEACLRFALGAPGIAVALAGMSRPEHVRANVALAREATAC